MMQVYRAKSGVLVISHASKPHRHDDSFWGALYGTYRKWYRRYKGVEPGPGRAGNVS